MNTICWPFQLAKYEQADERTRRQLATGGIQTSVRRPLRLFSPAPTSPRKTHSRGSLTRVYHTILLRPRPY